jgi:SAM-dependent methyltransferase
MEAYPRLFARFKILIDPMFPRLADYLNSPRHVIDIGCGYAIPAVWLLSLYPRAKVFGIDPDRKRVAIAIRALGDRGTAEVGGAPDLPAKAPGKVDTVLMLDMMHLLDDDALRLTLQRTEERLEPGGRLILRATIPSRKRLSWLRRLEEWRLQAVRATPHYRTVEAISTLLTGAGLTVTCVETAAADREEMWFVAEK